MVCNICKQDCVGFSTGDPAEDICSDCAFPMLKKASENALERISFSHYLETGEFVDGGDLMRRAIGMV